MQGSTNRRIVTIAGVLTFVVLAAIALPITLHERPRPADSGSTSVSPAPPTQEALTNGDDVAAFREKDHDGRHRERRSRRHHEHED